MQEITESAKTQNTPAVQISFLGPRGTFCQQALNQVAPETEAIHVPALDAPRAIKMVREGVVDYAVVPIENSVEGGINATLDSLALNGDLIIVAEMLVNISFVLAVRPGTKITDIKRISTHNAAWTQCRNWILENLPEVIHLPASSTAAGAAGLAQAAADSSLDPGYEATLVSPLAAEQYGLEVLRDDVADNPDAVTRFVMIGSAGKVPERTGHDKTTMMIQLSTDKSGALHSLLEQFASRGINLTRIESRPVGDALGRYAFSIDAEGHLADHRIQSVLTALYRVSPKVTFLGSYPSVEARPIQATPGNSDEDYLAARAWVKSLVKSSI